MYNKFFTIALIIALGLFCSCNHKIEQITMESDNEENYAIPIETALNSLDDFLASQGIISTKGGVRDYIDNYFSVSGSQTTKAGEKREVLYAINFKDDQGYALIAADKRISEDIIAVTTKGNVSEEDFTNVEDKLTPTENDDLTVDEYNEMVNSGALAQINRIVNQECLRYADAKLRLDETNTGGSNGGSSSTPVTYHWEVEKEVPRLMNTVWTQEGKDKLFNKYCPEVGLIWKKTAPAGCVCIAISQIMAYHEYPAPFACNGIAIDYKAIKNIYSYSNPQNTGSDIDKEMIAKFIVNIGGWCGTKYHSIFGKTWGFAWPSGAKKCLSTFGYENVTFKWGYDEDLVIKSLENGCPVFMSAIAKVFSGHAWVIDGYMKRKRVASTGSITDRQTLVHCNWGWHGKCNGYFTSGVFKTNEAVISDAFGKGMDEKYWHAFNTITYDNPKKSETDETNN